jgi:hypothetical protein
MNVTEINHLADAEFMSFMTGLNWHVCADTGGITAQGEFFKYWLDKIRDGRRYNLSYSDIFDTHAHPEPVSLAEAVGFISHYDPKISTQKKEPEPKNDLWRDELIKTIDAPCVQTAFSDKVKPKKICYWDKL